MFFSQASRSKINLHMFSPCYEYPNSLNLSGLSSTWISLNRPLHLIWCLYKCHTKRLTSSFPPFSPPFFTHHAIRDTRRCLISFSFVWLSDLPFRLGWKAPRQMRCYRDAAGTQLPSPTSLFLNYWTSIQDGYSHIYGSLTPRHTYNYPSKAVIVLISHVRCGRPLPCPRAVSMEIESQMLLKDITGDSFARWTCCR